MGKSEVSQESRFDLHSLVGMSNLASMCLGFAIIFMGSPIGQWEFDSWPVYSASFLGGFTTFESNYVLSTWVWLGLVEGFFQAFFNDEIHPWLHKHGSSSTIVVYIFHWVFLKIYVWFVIRDLHVPTWAHWGLGKTLTVVSTFAFIVVCSWLVYALLVRCPKLGQFF